jgi:hypothetical protein
LSLTLLLETELGCLAILQPQRGKVLMLLLKSKAMKGRLLLILMLLTVQYQTLEMLGLGWFLFLGIIFRSIYLASTMFISRVYVGLVLFLAWDDQSNVLILSHGEPGWKNSCKAAAYFAGLR